MKKVFVPALLLLASVSLRAQTYFELGLQGVEHIYKYNFVYGDNSLKADGSSCGVRLGLVKRKTIFQFSVLYSRQHIPELPKTNTEQSQQASTPQKVGLGLALGARYQFNTHKRAFPFLAAGFSGYVFNRNQHYSASAGPTFPGQNTTGNHQLAALLTPGVRCKLNGQFSLDLEPSVSYYFLKDSYYRHHLSFGIGFTLNYAFEPVKTDRDDFRNSDQ